MIIKILTVLRSLMPVYWKAKPELLEFDSSSGTQIFLLYLTDKEMNGNSFYFLTKSLMEILTSSQLNFVFSIR